MYAVIFRAKTGEMDDEYGETAAEMRRIAMDEYGCTEFTAVTEGSEEIAISYWPSLEKIAAWKQDSRHLRAQNRGREKWYKQYSVEVVEILREYQYPSQ